jgi:hypothetical protein
MNVRQKAGLVIVIIATSAPTAMPKWILTLIFIFGLVCFLMKKLEKEND